jgi:serine/threonine protein kinase/WD40 repeat protein
MSESLSKFEPVERLAEEFLDRYRRGEHPGLSEYTRKHPELAALIEEYFPTMVVMEELGSVGGQADKPRARTVMEGGSILEELGEYRIVREIGRGGMGIVYEAVQESLGRHVALKVLPFSGLMNPTQLERFRREARAAARLHHTNIVPVFGVGEFKGTHYYAMQFIHGQGLNEVLQEVRRLRAGKDEESPSRRVLAASVAESMASGKFSRETPSGLPEPQAGKAQKNCWVSTENSAGSSSQSHLTSQPDAQYFRSVAQIGAQVADALEYAHGQGVLHRDIKPSNLILDVSGRAWVTDFGLAKADETAELTDPGDIVGTLCYMAPERFGGEADARSDVYGLGITLYELATLQPAFADSNRARLIERVMCTEPPLPRKLDARIPRDLETILLKATAKYPNDRYPTAGALSDDLRRFLTDRPVRARRTPFQERVWRWCRRNPALAWLAAAVFSLSIVVAIISSFSAIRLGQETNRARSAEREAEEELYRSYFAQAQASRSSGSAGRRFEALVALKNAVLTAEKLSTKKQHLLELRNEAIACMILADLKTTKELRSNLVRDAGLGFDPKLEYYACGDGRGNLSICRTSDDGEIISLKGPDLRPASAPRSEQARFSPDGQYLAVKYYLGHVEAPKLYRVWHWRNARIVVEQPATGVVNLALDFTPDSRQVAIADNRDNSIRFYDLESGREVRRYDWQCQVQHLAFDPEGKRLAVSSSVPSKVQVREAATGKSIAAWPTPTIINGMSWQAQGHLLAGGGDDGRVYAWNLHTKLSQTPFEGHQSSVRNVYFSNRGDILASTGWDNKTLLWDPMSRQLLFSAPGYACGFSADDRQMAFFYGNRAGIWQIARAQECRLLISTEKERGTNGGLQFSADTRLLALGRDDGVAIWDTTTATQVARLPGGKACAVLFHPDGKSLVTTGQSGLIRWPISREESATVLGLQIGPPEVLDVQIQHWLDMAAWDASGNRLAVIDGQEKVFAIDLGHQNKRVMLGTHTGMGCVSVSPDGKWAATGTWRRQGLRIWDIVVGRLANEITCGPASGLFSPDGKWLLVSTKEGCRFLHVGSWQPGPFIDAPEPRAMAFSPDGRLLAMAPSPWQVRLIDTSSALELAALTRPDSGGNHISVFQSGRKPASRTDDGLRDSALGSETSSQRPVRTWIGLGHAAFRRKASTLDRCSARKQRDAFSRAAQD